MEHSSKSTPEETAAERYFRRYRPDLPSALLPHNRYVVEPTNYTEPAGWRIVDKETGATMLNGLQSQQTAHLAKLALIVAWTDGADTVTTEKATPLID